MCTRHLAALYSHSSPQIYLCIVIPPAVVIIFHLYLQDIHILGQGSSWPLSCSNSRPSSINRITPRLLKTNGQWMTVVVSTLLPPLLHTPCHPLSGQIRLDTTRDCHESPNWPAILTLSASGTPPHPIDYTMPTNCNKTNWSMLLHS